MALFLCAGNDTSPAPYASFSIFPHASVSALNFFRSRLWLLLVSLCLLGTGLPSQAQNATGSVLDDPLVRFQAERGLTLLYNMQFDEARVLFTQISTRFPDHPVGPFLHALTLWWEILLDLSDTRRDAAFIRAMDDVNRRADRLLRRNPRDFDALFFKGAALGFRGRLRTNRGGWLRAANDGRNAMDYVLEVHRSQPTVPDFGFGRGLYDYYMAIIPRQYPLLRPALTFFPNANKDRGIALLERTAARGHYLRGEAAYFLAQIYYVHEGDFTNTRRHVQWLRTTYPENPFFHALEGRMYQRWGFWDESRPIFVEIMRRHRAGRAGYGPAFAEQALYYQARAHMAKGEFRAALPLLTELETVASRLPADTYFKTVGRLRLGMAYDALGQREQALMLYRQVARMQRWGDSQERARGFIQTPYAPAG